MHTYYIVSSSTTLRTIVRSMVGGQKLSQWSTRNVRSALVAPISLACCTIVKELSTELLLYEPRSPSTSRRLSILCARRETKDKKTRENA